MKGQAATIDEHLHETKITHKKKESYKTTELGLIPESWKIVKFEKVLNIFNGYAFKSTDAVESSNTQLIRMGNLYQNKLDLERQPIFYPDSYAQKYSKYVLQEGDLIISLTGTSEKEDYGFTVKINKTNKKLLLNQRVARIDIISADVNRDYIFYFLLSRIFLTPLFLTAKGMKQANLSTNAIKKLNVVIPPLEEQRKIARVLSLVQDAIAQKEQLITLTTELKKTLMHKLFTEGTRGEPLDKKEIGFIPKSWKVVTLQTAAKSFQYGTSVKCDYEKIGYPVLRIPNVIGGYIDICDLKYGQPKPNEIDVLKLIDGDILFVRTNGTKENSGRCSIYRGELGNDCYFASYLIRVRVDKTELSPAFLDEYTRTEMGTSFLSGQAIRTADGKFNINSGTLQRMLVPKPSLDEQREIAYILSNVDTKISNYLLIKEQLEDLFRTLVHQLMTAQIRVDDLNFTPINIELQGGNE